MQQPIPETLIDSECIHTHQENIPVELCQHFMGTAGSNNNAAPLMVSEVGRGVTYDLFFKKKTGALTFIAIY
jgi:hypothetical protein